MPPQPSAGVHGPRSVRARAAKAEKNGITPAWHTDRSDYARRNDTHWTRSNNLPAYVIAKNGDLRVVSGFRALDFWHCDIHAVYPCPDGVRRCGRFHATPKPRDGVVTLLGVRVSDGVPGRGGVGLRLSAQAAAAWPATQVICSQIAKRTVISAR
jgi:hypothetical protein